MSDYHTLRRAFVVWDEEAQCRKQRHELVAEVDWEAIDARIDAEEAAKRKRLLGRINRPGRQSSRRPACGLSGT